MSKFSPRQLIKHPGRLSYHDMILETDGLISYWNFGAGQGNKLWDQKSTNHGTIDGATWTQKSNGLWTLDFDGDNDYVEVPNSPDWDLSNNDFTIELWSLFDSFSSNRTLIRHKAPIYDWHLIRIGNSYVKWEYYNSVGTTRLLYNANLLYPLVLNVWYHFAVTRTGNVFRLFGNNILLQTRTWADTIQHTDDVLELAGSGNWSFYGMLKDVVIYNVALSSETIQKHYQVGVWEGLAA